MNSMRRVMLVISFVVVTPWVAASVPLAAAQPPKQQEVYVPIDQLPPGEQMPAARLLIGAYVFVPVVLFLYLLSLARRMSTVQREMQRLESDLKRTGRT